MTQRHGGPAPYPTTWDPPDLNNYGVARGLRSLWNNAVLAQNVFRIFSDYPHYWEGRMGKDDTAMGLLFSNPNIGDRHSWEAVRPLGSGSHGVIALWHRKDEQGRLLDEIAIKQSNVIPPFRVGEVAYGKPGLTQEAALQSELNNRDCRNVLVLRNFKYYDTEGKYRHYFEFCPHGDLDRLKSRYRAYGRYLPELFLWHLFQALAAAVREMSHGTWRSPVDNSELGNNWYMLHMDLKPAQIFLGYQPPIVPGIDPGTPPPRWTYPTIKMSDFGLASFTHIGDGTNPRHFWDTGTDCFKPPEQTLFGTMWQNPPNHQRVKPPLNPTDEGRAWRRAYGEPGTELQNQRAVLERQGEYKFTTKHNIWAIGKIMYDVLTLGEGDELENLQNGIDEIAYHNGQANTFPDVFSAAPGHSYSRELCDLVSSCLRIDQKKRPTPASLQGSIRAGMARADSLAQNAVDVAGTAFLNAQVDRDSAANAAANTAFVAATAAPRRAGTAPAMKPREAAEEAHKDAVRAFRWPAASLFPHRLYYKGNDISMLAPYVPQVKNLAYIRGAWNELVNSPYGNRDCPAIIPNSAFERQARAAGNWEPPREYRHPQRPPPFPAVGYIHFDVDGLQMGAGTAGTHADIYVHEPSCAGNCGNRCQRMRDSQWGQMAQPPPATAPNAAPASGNAGNKQASVTQVPNNQQHAVPQPIAPVPLPAVEAAPVPPPPLPTQAMVPPPTTQPTTTVLPIARDYWALTVARLKEELNSRSAAPANYTGLKKADIIELLLAADRSGNLGNGANPPVVQANRRVQQARRAKKTRTRGVNRS